MKYAVEFCIDDSTDTWTLDQVNRPPKGWHVLVFDTEAKAQARADDLNDVFTKTKHRVTELTSEEVEELGL